MPIVAIHQPNFFPWLGYFDKIARCDHFVFLDHVQFQKTGGVWSNRVQVLVGGQVKWLTAPIVRSFHGVRRVNEIEFSGREPWRKKMIGTVRANYGRAPFFDETMAVLEPLIVDEDNHLTSYNRHAIVTLAAHVGLRTPQWHSSSQLQLSERSTNLLVEITRQVGGDIYMCGGGAGEYQQDEIFAAAGMALRYQDFQHPEYLQRAGEPFVRGLSIIDALMHCGRDGVHRLLAVNR